jgi:hypothetical protein
MRYRLPPTRTVPKDSTEYTRAGVDAIVYLAHGGRPHAIGYKAKQNRPAFNFLFRSIERRDEYVREWFDGVAREQAAKKAWKAEQAAKRAAGHGLKAGDVLYASWGYEQTNIDFYQVVDASSPKSVMLREIAANTTTAGGCFTDRGNCLPARDQFTGEAFRSIWNGSSFHAKGRHLSVHNGQPLYWSSYA